MATINEYPNLTQSEVPYLVTLKLKLIHAKEFTPHKIGYYAKLVKDWEEGIQRAKINSQLKPKQMATTTQLSPESVTYLLDKKIARVGSNYIELNNGFRIYIDEGEIEHINSYNE